MTSEQIKRFVQNRIVHLEQLKLGAERAGNVDEMLRFDAELLQTQETLNRINEM